jgi:hypothetical protein
VKLGNPVADMANTLGKLSSLMDGLKTGDFGKDAEAGMDAMNAKLIEKFGLEKLGDSLHFLPFEAKIDGLDLHLAAEKDGDLLLVASQNDKVMLYAELDLHDVKLESGISHIWQKHAGTDDSI